MDLGWLFVAGALLAGCGGTRDGADGGKSALKGAHVVINELAGTGGDFVELYNPGDADFDLTGFGLTDTDSDGGVRYLGSLRFVAGSVVPTQGYLTIFLEANCPAMVAPCVRGEFGLSQSSGERITLLDQSNLTVAQESYPPNGAGTGFSWARKTDGAETFEVQRRSPGAANAP
jgi:hypothetical protein